MGIRRMFPAVMVLAVTAGCKSTPAGISPAPATPGPAQVTATSGAVEPSGGKGLPTPSLTPGERTAQPNERTEVSEANKQKTLEAYGAANDPKAVVCRLIPPEIGGTNNPPNLFATTPWFAGLKARLDEKIVELVKTKQITAEQAESDLKSNWIKASHKYYVRNYGEGTEAEAKKKEDALRWEH